MTGSQQDLPWRWASVILVPLESLMVVWSIPFVILAVGIPIAFVVSLLSSLF